MRLKNLLLALLLFVAGFVSAQEMPSIPVDTAVRIGKLSNGLTYYIRHNNYPEHRVNFYIAQRVGSIQENDDQRGLAHFLEHMAFNGSDHFKGNGVIDYTRSLGVEFGSNLNAYTSIDQTVYRICDVPSTRQSALDSCLLILKDWSNGLSLETNEIAKERGVIHEEWRLDSSPSLRMFERNLEALYPGSKYGLRMPIGKMEIIDNFKPEVLRKYYQKWYRPDNQGIIVVGDVDVNHAEAQIKALFGGIKVAPNAAKVVDEPVPDNAKPIIVIDKDKEQQYSIVEMMFKHEATPDSMKNSIAYMAEEYGKEMVSYMLNQRLSEVSQKADAPFSEAGCDDGQYIYAKTKDAFQITALPKEGKTEESVAALMREVLRATKYGFTATEYSRAKAQYLSNLEKGYNNRNKRENAKFGDEYRDNFLDKEPIPSLEFTYQAMSQIAPAIPVEAINEMMGELVSKSDTNLVVMNFNNEKAGAVYPTKEGIMKAIDGARAENITAYVDNVKDEPLMKTMPAKGSIKSEKENKLFGSKEITLSNGAKVILKKTDFKDDEIVMKGYAKGGTSMLDAKDFANGKMFDAAINSCGLGEFDNTELEKALAGKQASVNLSINKHYLNVEGSTTPKDLETMLQLTYLNFTNIKKDQKSYDKTLGLIETMLKNKALSPDQAFSDSVTVTMNSHNPRFKSLEMSDLKNVSYDRILDMAKGMTANAADYTFIFAGNFNEDTLLPLICQYIGSLPSKGKAESNYRSVGTYATGKIINQFDRKMETPKATAVMAWYNVKTPYTLENNIKADAAGQILDMVYLKKIREDASAAYSAGAYGYSVINGKEPMTIIIGQCPMKPEKKDLAISIMRQELAAMATSVDAEMLTKVKSFMLKDADDKAKKNGHWLNVLSEYDQNNIDEQTDYKKIVNALTPASISKFVKDVIVGSGNDVEIIMLPEAAKK